MPLTVPNLDDRNYTDLVAEALSMLPRYAPEWTNHNPSDPGITLIELLSYFTELLIYRLNRVTRENKIKFLRLLREVKPDEEKLLAKAAVTEVDETLRQTVLALRQPQRAVTCEDYEYLARAVTANNPDGPKVIRARSFVRTNLELADDEPRKVDCPGHMSLVLVLGSERGPEVFTSWLQYVRDQLEPMRLLTTRLHVVKPRYLWVSLGAMIRTHPHASFEEVKNRAIEKLERYFSPLPGGGPTGEGWPFGRAIYLSEVYKLLDEVEGVDYVQDVRVLHLTTRGEALGDERTTVGIQIGVRSTATVGVNSRLGCETPADTDRLIRDALGRLTAVALRPYELVRVILRKDDLLPWDSSMRAQSARA
ncbi:MAG TPA: hypothetical protein VKK81_17930 [Candidatus Binatia bacterium]|nr:hypothetical protein [Candidatus Binatia bacterium]